MYSLCMPSSARLRPRDREFFRLVSEAATCNPFGDRYLELLRTLACCDASVPYLECLERMERSVHDRIRDLEAGGASHVTHIEGNDQEIVREAVLFDVYWRAMTSFDDLIERQVEAGDRSLPVPFARDVLGELARRGFAPDEALRHFAIGYQVRRAFYFIDRGLVGRSPCMQELRRHLWNNVFTHDMRLYRRHLWNRMEDFSTLLLGETGTGKGAAAAAIGRSGFIPFDEKKGCFAESFARSFIALNLSQFPETLIESELFGHRKGAFTGAVETHEGVFARCSPCGAIFLDEIGDVAVPVQIKLLQVLQERTFSPVGSHEKQRFRGRVIAATNKPLQTLRAEGRFRDDFFFRLCSDVIVVPPLRQRIQEAPEELDDLIALIAERMTGKPLAPGQSRDHRSEAPGEIGALVRAVLDSTAAAYSWPGNVRELEQAVRRIVLTRCYSGEQRGAPADLAGRLQSGIASGSLDAEQLLAGYCRLLHERHGTYEEVARRTHLDRRTVKAYIVGHRQPCPPPLAR
jgi:DNA-binding NtrC family response regulator